MLSYRADDLNFLEFWVKMDKMTWKSRSMTPIFNTYREHPMMHVWCKFGDRRSNLLSCGQGKVYGQTGGRTDTGNDNTALLPERSRDKMTSFTTLYLYIYKCPANETTMRQNTLTPMPLIFVKNSVIHSAIEKHRYEIELACTCTSSDIRVHHGEEIIRINMNGYICIYIYVYVCMAQMCVYITWYVSWHTEARENGHNFADAIFSNAFSWMEIFVFSLEFTWVCF